MCYALCLCAILVIVAYVLLHRRQKRRNRIDDDTRDIPDFLINPVSYSPALATPTKLPFFAVPARIRNECRFARL